MFHKCQKCLNTKHSLILQPVQHLQIKETKFSVHHVTIQRVLTPMLGTFGLN